MLCCGNGKGRYRIIDNCGNAVIDSKETPEKFGKKGHTFKAKTCSAVSLAPDLTNNNCKDKEGKFALKVFKKRKTKKRTCKFYAAKGKCEKKLKNKGIFVWQLCPQSCDKCGSNYS